MGYTRRELSQDESVGDVIFRGASTISEMPMMKSAATPINSPRAMRLRNAWNAISAAWARLDHCGEGDQAAVRCGVTGGQQQENAERDIDAQHHCQRRLLPREHDQWVNQRAEDQSHDDQHNLQRTISAHKLPSCQVKINEHRLLIETERKGFE